MSELIADCDALREKIRKLEEDNRALRGSDVFLRKNLSEAEAIMRSNCDTKMELLKILGDTADHLGVSKEGTNQEISFRIWMAVNDLRKGGSTDEIKKLKAELEDKTGKLEYTERQYRIQTGNCDEMMQYLAYLAVAVGVDKEMLGRLGAQEVYSRTLEEMQKLKEESVRDQRNAAKSQAEAARYLDDLKDYEKAFKELDAAAKKAMEAVGMQYGAGKWTKRECLIDALERLSEAALNDTVDSKIKELEQVCYHAESQSGCLSTKQNPWERVKEVLETMAAKIRRQEHQVPDEVWRKMWAILSNLGLSQTWGGGMLSQAEEAMHVLRAIETKAYECQNIRAACLRLKELL